jgi:threonine dehydratase
MERKMTLPDGAVTIDAVRDCRARLGDKVLTTPVHEWRGPAKDKHLGGAPDIILKLELFQYTGSFKARGAINVVQSLTPEALARGVAAVSAGNHAIAAAYAAHSAGAHAKIVMKRGASPVRIARAQSFGAEIVFVDDFAEAFALLDEIVEQEGRTLVHPFEGPLIAQGTGTLALEFSDQAGPLDALVVAIGGGGLCAGVSAVMKQLQPGCRVIGVEPEGAANMHLSFLAGEPARLEKLDTIADSLAPPYSLPYSFGLCRANVDEIVLINDEAMRRAMGLMFDEMKLAVEPAGAAAVAALMGPLRGRLSGRVGVVVCGANIEAKTWAEQVLPA